MAAPPADAGRRSGLTGGLLWIAAAALLFVYGYRIADTPPKWEEPLRCLVAMEMTHGGDWLVPRLMGEDYLKKPPLHSWLIAIAAGGETSGITPLRARLVTLCALAGICLLLWRLGIGSEGHADPRPALIFATTGIVVQFSRTAEIDILFCFFVTAAFAAVEFGRRRNNVWLQWFVPQLLVGAGVLTKGLAVLFFYPPVLAWAWAIRPRARFSLLPFVLGLAGMVGVVASWLVPYAAAASLGDLQGRWVREMSRVTVDKGSQVLFHLVTYPFLLLGIALPWSLLLLRPPRRTLQSWKRGREEPYLGFCLAIVGWIVLVYLFVPGTDGRYLIPALPFLSVLMARLLPEFDGTRSAAMARWPWALLAALLFGYAFVGGASLEGSHRMAIWVTIGVGVLLLATVALMAERERARPAAAVVLGLALIYGTALVGVGEARKAQHNERFVLAARELSHAIVSDDPVVCRCSGGEGRKLAFALSRFTGRPVRAVPPDDGPYYLVENEDQAPEGSAVPLGAAWRFRLWRREP